MIPTISDADKMLKILIERDRKIINGGFKSLSNPEAFYNHSRCVSNSGYLMGCGLYRKQYSINPELVQVSALLHDVGKCVYTAHLIEKDPDLEFDSIVGADYLESLGYKEVADVIRPSFVTKEMLELKPDMFPDINPKSLEPETWEQKVVVYADAHVTGRGSIVSLDERISDIRKRYDPDSLIIRALDKKGGRWRLRNLSEEIEDAIGLL